MRRFTILNIALILLLIALPLISIGTMNNQAGLWMIGLLLLATGLLIPPVLRLIHAARDPKDESDVAEEP